MRLLADENTHRVVVSRLRRAGFEVEWIKESTPGVSDIEILERADIGSFILVTNDRDFGDLIFNRNQPVPIAILYTRLPHREAETTADLLTALLAEEVPRGQMITVTKDGNRIKPFPTGA